MAPGTFYSNSSSMTRVEGRRRGLRASWRVPRRGTNVLCLRRHFIFILFHQEKHLCLPFSAKLNYFPGQLGEGGSSGGGEKKGVEGSGGNQAQRPFNHLTNFLWHAALQSQLHFVYAKNYSAHAFTRTHSHTWTYTHTHAHTHIAFDCLLVFNVISRQFFAAVVTLHLRLASAKSS